MSNVLLFYSDGTAQAARERVQTCALTIRVCGAAAVGTRYATMLELMFHTEASDTSPSPSQTQNERDERVRETSEFESVCVYPFVSFVQAHQRLAAIGLYACSASFIDKAIGTIEQQYSKRGPPKGVLATACTLRTLRTTELARRLDRIAHLGPIRAVTLQAALARLMLHPAGPHHLFLKVAMLSQVPAAQVARVLVPELRESASVRAVSAFVQRFGVAHTELAAVQEHFHATIWSSSSGGAAWFANQVCNAIRPLALLCLWDDAASHDAVVSFVTDGILSGGGTWREHMFVRSSTATLTANHCASSFAAILSRSARQGAGDAGRCEPERQVRPRRQAGQQGGRKKATDIMHVDRYAQLDV